MKYTVCFLFTDNGNHVLMQRKDRTQFAGRYNGVGGKIEPGEAPLEGARREIREETGLKVKLDPGFRKVVTFSPKPQVLKDVVYFGARPAGGELKRQEEEVLEAAWHTFGEALALITFENDRDVLRAFIAYYERG